MTHPLVKLGEVVEVLSGFAFKSEFFNDCDGMPVVRIRDVVRGYTDTYYVGPYGAQFVVNDGEILVGMDGNFNAARWRGGRALLNQRVCKITAKPSILDESYLFHYLPAVLKKIEDATPFVTVKHLSAGDLRDELIPLPPLPEQRRIAAILDKADALRTKRREALAQLDRLAQSIFVEMFGDPVTNPMGWQRVCFEEFFSDLTASCPKLQSSAYKEAGAFPVVDQGQKAIAAYCDDSSFVSSSVVPITLFGDHTRVVKHIDFPFVVGADGAKVLRAADGINARYASHLLSALPIPNLGYSRHMKEVKRLQFACPPKEMQAAFERRLQATDLVRAKHQMAEHRSEHLFSSLQHRAFSGRL